MYKFKAPLGRREGRREGEKRVKNIDFESIDKRGRAGRDRPLLAPCQPLIERKPAINITFLSWGERGEGGADFIIARDRGAGGSGCAISVTYAPALHGFILRVALRD